MESSLSNPASIHVIVFISSLEPLPTPVSGQTTRNGARTDSCLLPRVRGLPRMAKIGKEASLQLGPMRPSPIIQRSSNGQLYQWFQRYQSLWSVLLLD